MPTDEDKPPFNIDEEKPADWFEPLYASSNSSGNGVPWANMSTHPAFEIWLSGHSLEGSGKAALVVGCGMGDDAIALEQRGFCVTAFDVSDTAIAYCRERFPESTADFVQADLLQAQEHWNGRFDFVLEIYTVQALPPKYETELIDNIARFVAPGGRLLVIAEVSDEARSFENGPPWLLTPAHVEAFVARGLAVEDRRIEPGALQSGGSDTYITCLRRRE